MILHSVRLDFSGMAVGDRERVESRLRELRAVPGAIGFTVARDTEQPDVTGLVCWFPTHDDLVAYHAHPLHDAVGSDVVASGVAAARLDVEVMPPVGD
jgi:hypothetical protein